MTPADRAKESLLAGRGFIGRQLVLTGKPPEVFSGNTPRCRKCCRVCFSARDAMAMPQRIQARDFIGHSPAVTTAPHFTDPFIQYVTRASNPKQFRLG